MASTPAARTHAHGRGFVRGHGFVRSAPHDSARRVSRVPILGYVLFLGCAILAPHQVAAGSTAAARDAAVPAPAAEAPAAGAPVGDSTASPESCLRAICDRLIERRRPDGLFGCDPCRWWETSFQVRTLLAGSEILGDPRYLDAARDAVLVFLGERAEDGGWCAWHSPRDDSNDSGARTIPSSAAPAAATRPADDCASRNLADLGTITACLSLMAPYLTPADRDAALRAHRDYLDRFAKSYERPDGACANGLYKGAIEQGPYSVATATQAGSLLSLYEATDEMPYLRRAEKAARALAAGWSGDGRPLIFAHDRAAPVATETTAFGDLYYVLEALIRVEGATDDASLKATIRTALRAYLFGSRGFLRRTEEDGWIAPPAEASGGCKGNGMLGILIASQRILGADSTLDARIDAGTRRLCDAGTRDAYGVLALPERLGEEGSACEVFAALSLAERIRPGIVYGRSTSLRVNSAVPARSVQK